MNRTIAIAQQKGGVGKTTVTLGIAAAIANREMRVLVIDADPQANASQTLLPDYRERMANTDSPMYTLNDLMEPGVGAGDIDEAIIATGWDGVDLLASEQALAHRDAEGSTGIETRLRTALRGLRTEYDVILIDCPPSLGRLTVNSLLAAREVVLVAQPDAYSAQALDQIDKTLETIKMAYEHEVSVAGLILNQYDNTIVAQTQKAQFMRRFGGLLAVIPKRTALAAAAAAHQSIFTVDRPDTGALMYLFERIIADLGIKPPVRGVA